MILMKMVPMALPTVPIEVPQIPMVQIKVPLTPLVVMKMTRIIQKVSCQPTTGSLHNDQDIKSFQDNLEKKAKPSNLSSELNNHHDTSILGQVHLALATYHEICRFT